MLLDLKLTEFLAQAASDAPTPGGGGIAALVGALGACMGEMAANFTVGRPKYAAVEAEVKILLAELSRERAALAAGLEADAAAFAAVDAAYGRPKATEAEKQARSQAIAEALRQALEPPRKVLHSALAACRQLPRLAEIGNPNLVSDTGVAAILCAAAAQAAELNVRINLAALKDEALAAAIQSETAAYLAEIQDFSARTLQLVGQRIG